MAIAVDALASKKLLKFQKPDAHWSRKEKKKGYGTFSLSASLCAMTEMEIGVDTQNCGQTEKK